MIDIDLKKLASLADDPGQHGDDIVAAIRDMLDVGHVTFKILRFDGSQLYQGNFGYSTLPFEWSMLYMSQGYWEHDPIVKLSQKRASIFDWSEAEPCFEVRNMAAHADKFGISHQGFSIPIHGPFHDTSVLSIADLYVCRNADRWEAFKLEAVKQLMPVAAMLHDRVSRTLSIGKYAEESVALSKSDKDVLFWAWQGKSMDETAEILATSPKAIAFQLASCQERLGAVTIDQALSRAFAADMINPTEFGYAA